MAIKDVSGQVTTLQAGDLFVIESTGSPSAKPYQLDVYKVVSVEGHLVHAYIPQRVNDGSKRQLIVVNSTVASLVKIGTQFEDDIVAEKNKAQS